jgi:hypothetical protein
MRRLLALVAVLALAAPAAAATRSGITPQAPSAGAVVEEGSRPVFKGRVTGRGSVWVHVSTSRKADDEGVIGNDQMIQRARRKKGGFRVQARYFNYPGFWLNTPGTYYWQAHRIACGEGDDCLQEGPVVKFRVG